jgi:hypothetical protein
MQVELYVCTHPECDNYYGSRNMFSHGSLEESWSGPKVEDAAHMHDVTGTRFHNNRAECPDCKDAGRGRVMRARVHVEIPTDAIKRPGGVQAPTPPSDRGPMTAAKREELPR